MQTARGAQVGATVAAHGAATRAANDGVDLGWLALMRTDLSDDTDH